MKRRSFIAALAAPALATAAPQGLTMFQNYTTERAVFDPFQIIANCRISSGPAKLIGAYRIVPNVGRINWYFSNLGLLGTARYVPSENLRSYLNAYIRNLKADFTIDDYQADLVTPMKPDSHDSYAATFLSLAAIYVRLTGDVPWFNANVDTLKNIAYYNLARQVKANKLTRTFQIPDAYDVGFFMDNCEVYRGLRDLCLLLDDHGHGMDAMYYNSFAVDITHGLMNLWDYNKSGFRPSDAHASAETSFYPGVTCQVFAQAFDVAPLSAYYTSAWQYVTKFAPKWSALVYNQFPWMILSTVAAKRKLTKQAQAALAQCEYLHRIQPELVTINELGWYQRTRNLLANKSEI